MENVENQLRTAIFEALKKVTPENSPKVWKELQTKSGYKFIENKIIYMVINDHITPDACVPQIEVEML